LRSCQLCRYSRTSQHFMEPEGWLPCSQEPSTGPHVQRDEFSPYHFILSFFKIHFNIIHTLTSWPSKWSPSFSLSHQYPICIPLLPYSCYIPCPSLPRLLDHSKYIWRLGWHK
jgi:hypothetical protein